MKATVGQNILLGAFSADRRNFNACNARQMFLVENVLVKGHKDTNIYNNENCVSEENYVPPNPPIGSGDKVQTRLISSLYSVVTLKIRSWSPKKNQFF